MLCAHIAPVATYVSAHVEQILSDQGVDTVGDDQAADGKSG